MTEPTTKAGRALRRMWSLDGGTEQRLTNAIVAVESEARAAERERLAGDIGRGEWDSMFEGVLTRAINKARGIANEEFVLAIAQRDEARAERDVYARTITRLESAIRASNPARLRFADVGPCLEDGCPLPDSAAWHDEWDRSSGDLPYRLNHPMLLLPGACHHQWFEDMEVGSVSPVLRCRRCRVVTAA